jgi:4-diphosphocytidyl-2-C-methyl-D-erythritol kinase
MSDQFPDMSTAYELFAPAKTNLWLRVHGQREDGYHEIETRMVKLDLQDRIRFQWRDDDHVVLRCSDPSLPGGEDNLAVKAVRALERYTNKVFSISIDLEKNIPSGAGLGGGSSDAAAVLRAINVMGSLFLPEDELAAIGAEIGSDVPFFVYDRTCDCRGRGEIVTPVVEADAPGSLPIFLIKPGFEVSAGWAYQQYASSSEYDGFVYATQSCSWGEMVNDLERPVFEKHIVLGEMKSWLLAQPEVSAALMSGSGSTMLAILKPGIDGSALETRALERYGENSWTFLGQTS